MQNSSWLERWTATCKLKEWRLSAPIHKVASTVRAVSIQNSRAGWLFTYSSLLVEDEAFGEFSF
jgi:hypothetical protein